MRSTTDGPAVKSKITGNKASTWELSNRTEQACLQKNAENAGKSLLGFHLKPDILIGKALYEDNVFEDSFIVGPVTFLITSRDVRPS